MAYDYAPKVAFANKMIDKYGRSVVFVQVASDIDPTDPLAGPVSVPVVSDVVKAAFVYPSGLLQLGMSTTNAQLFKNCEQIAIVGNHGIDYAAQTFLNDTDGMVWKVDVVQEFKPGDTSVLYYVGVIKP